MDLEEERDSLLKQLAERNVEIDKRDTKLAQCHAKVAQSQAKLQKELEDQVEAKERKHNQIRQTWLTDLFQLWEIELCYLCRYSECQKC